MMPLTPKYTLPDVSELSNQQAMNGGKPDKKPDLRGLPELNRIDGQTSGFGAKPMMQLVKDDHTSVLQEERFLTTHCQATAAISQVREK